MTLRTRLRKGGKVGAGSDRASQAGHRYSVVASVLFGAALGEFLILRLFMRMGALLPDAPSVRPLYEGLVLVGAALVNLAFFLAMAIVGRRAWDCLSQHRWGDRLGGLFLALPGGVALAAAMGRLWGLPSPWLLLAQSLVLPPALVYCAWGASGGLAFRVWLWGVVGLYALAAYSALVAPLGVWGIPLPGAPVAIQSAEGLMLLLAVGVALWLRPRWNPLAFALAGGMSVLFLGLGLSRPWTASTIAMWSIGLPVSLGVPVYALVLGVFVYSLAYAFKRDRRVLGLALLALSGLRVDIPYIAVLALAGVVLVVWPSLQTEPVGIQKKTAHSVEQAKPAPASFPH